MANPQDVSMLDNRRGQMFPVLDATDLGRICRFGVLRNYASGEKLVTAGTPSLGMFVLLHGAIAVIQRDGLGRVVPLIRYQPGQFLAEVGQLSGRPSLVDGVADGDVEVLLVDPVHLRALLIAEAELGERITRALILRRVALIEGGRSGAVLIGDPAAPAIVRLQHFLRRNGYPLHLLSPTDELDAQVVVEQYIADSRDVAVVCPNGTVLRNPSDDEVARCLGMVDSIEHDELHDVAIVGAGPAGRRQHPRAPRARPARLMPDEARAARRQRAAKRAVTSP